MSVAVESKANPVVEMIRVILTETEERIRRGAWDYKRDRLTLTKHHKLAVELGDQCLLGEIDMVLGQVEYEGGNFPEAGKRWQAAFNIFKQLGDLAHMAAAQNYLGELYFRLNDLGEALECYQIARELAEQAGDIGAIMEIEGNLGMLWLLRGENLKARICFSLVIAVTEYESWQHIISIVKARRGLAEVYLAAKNFNAAWHEANEAEHLAQGRGLKLALAKTYLTKAHIAEHDPSTPGATAYYYKLGREALRSYGNPVMLARALLQEARYARQMGNIAEAHAFAAEARDTFRQLNLGGEIDLAEAFLAELN